MTLIHIGIVIFIGIQKELHGAKQQLSSQYYEAMSMKKDLKRTKEEAQAANQQLVEQREHYNALTAKANRLEGRSKIILSSLQLTNWRLIM